MQARIEPQSAPPRPASALLDPVTVAGLRLRNRIAMAPMTRERSEGGVPGEDVAAYYRRRAEGGVGLIITEGSPPNAQGAFGSKIWHVGAFDPKIIGMDDTLAKTERLSPSGLAGPDHPLGRPMKQIDIDDTIAAFATAAAAARRIGFDGIELHGAHGYLLDQFLWAGTNRREDRYDLSNRTCFISELVGACRKAVGPDFPIVFRLSQWKQLDHAALIAEDPDELGMLVGELADAGVDILHCSTRRFWEPAFDGDPTTLAGWVRKLSGLPTIMVGSVTLGTDFKSDGGKIFAEVQRDDVALLEALLARKEFDLVAIGRALIANPNWPHLLRDGRLAEMRPFEKRMLDAL